MPRGFSPILMSLTTTAFEVSITDTFAEPSFGTYAIGAAHAPNAATRAPSIAMNIESMRVTRGVVPLHYATAHADDFRRGAVAQPSRLHARRHAAPRRCRCTPGPRAGCRTAARTGGGDRDAHGGP